MRVFRWLTANEIPPELDLRLCGWTLLNEADPTEECVAIAHGAGMTPVTWLAFMARHGRQARRLIVLVGIDDAVDRAHLLRRGFGEVASSDLQRPELEARAIRLTELEDTLPRYRHVGPLSLDLLAREAFTDDQPLGLHPREFGLLWRLADTPGKPVSKESLIRDVWRMGFVPETNSLAVHVSRLRGKLNLAGLEGLLATASTGGYYLQVAENGGQPDPRLREVRSAFHHHPAAEFGTKALARHQ